MNGTADRIVGWDVGGANIKAARIDDAGRLEAIERPFPLWREPDRLPVVLTEIADLTERTHSLLESVAPLLQDAHFETLIEAAQVTAKRAALQQDACSLIKDKLAQLWDQRLHAVVNILDRRKVQSLSSASRVGKP